MPLDICSMLEENLRKGEETIQSRKQQPTGGAGKHRLAGHAELFIVAKALRGEGEGFRRKDRCFWSALASTPALILSQAGG